MPKIIKAKPKTTAVKVKKPAPKSPVTAKPPVKGSKKPTKKNPWAPGEIPRTYKEPARDKVRPKQGVTKQNYWYDWMGTHPDEYVPQNRLLNSGATPLGRATQPRGTGVQALPNYMIDRIVTLQDGSRIWLSELNRRRGNY